jgi:hypothetical protein
MDNNTTTTRNYLRLLIVIGGPCLLVLIFVCTCLITQRRARELGVLPRRHYSFYSSSGRVLPPPKSLGPISSRDPSAAGSRDNLIVSDPTTCDSIHLSVPSVPTITIDTVKWGVTMDDQIFLEVNSIRKLIDWRDKVQLLCRDPAGMVWYFEMQMCVLNVCCKLVKAFIMLLWNKRKRYGV